MPLNQVRYVLSTTGLNALISAKATLSQDYNAGDRGVGRPISALWKEQFGKCVLSARDMDWANVE